MHHPTTRLRSSSAATATADLNQYVTEAHKAVAVRHSQAILSPRTATAEMLAVAEVAQAHKPVLHVTHSWPPESTISVDDALAYAERFAQFAHLDGSLHLLAAHGDARCRHVHGVYINADPQTRETLLTVPFAEIVEQFVSEGEQTAKPRTADISARARDAETWNGNASLMRYLRTEISRIKPRDAEHLDRALASQGILRWKSKSGFVFADVTARKPIVVASSKVGVPDAIRREWATAPILTELPRRRIQRSYWERVVAGDLPAPDLTAEQRHARDDWKRLREQGHRVDVQFGKFVRRELASDEKNSTGTAEAATIFGLLGKRRPLPTKGRSRMAFLEKAFRDAIKTFSRFSSDKLAISEKGNLYDHVHTQGAAPHSLVSLFRGIDDKPEAVIYSEIVKAHNALVASGVPPQQYAEKMRAALSGFMGIVQSAEAYLAKHPDLVATFYERAAKDGRKTPSSALTLSDENGKPAVPALEAAEVLTGNAGAFLEALAERHNAARERLLAQNVQHGDPQSNDNSDLIIRPGNLAELDPAQQAQPATGPSGDQLKDLHERFYKEFTNYVSIRIDADEHLAKVVKGYDRKNSGARAALKQSLEDPDRPKTLDGLNDVAEIVETFRGVAYEQDRAAMELGLYRYQIQQWTRQSYRDYLKQYVNRNELDAELVDHLVETARKEDRHFTKKPSKMQPFVYEPGLALFANMIVTRKNHDENRIEYRAYTGRNLTTKTLEEQEVPKHTKLLFWEKDNEMHLPALKWNKEGQLDAALMVAFQRWGAVQLSGNAMYMANAMRRCVELGIPVTDLSEQQKQSYEQMKAEHEQKLQREGADVPLVLPRWAQKASRPLGPDEIQLKDGEKRFGSGIDQQRMNYILRALPHTVYSAGVKTVVNALEEPKAVHEGVLVSTLRNEDKTATAVIRGDDHVLYAMPLTKEQAKAKEFTDVRDGQAVKFSTGVEPKIGLIRNENGYPSATLDDIQRDIGDKYLIEANPEMEEFSEALADDISQILSDDITLEDTVVHDRGLEMAP